jgi:hypothetical protein
MKSAIGIVALAAAFLAGCASHEQKLRSLGDTLHSTPLVTAPFGYGIVSVAPDPIVLNLRAKEPKVTWLAPDSFTFPNDQKGRGIEILGLVVDANDRPVDLRANPDALKAPGVRVRPGTNEHFRCTYSASLVTCVPGQVVKYGVYRYVIRLRDKAGNQLVGDPTVIPME